MVDRACLSVKSGLTAKKLAVSPFCLENIYVARFGLVEAKSVCFNARLGFLVSLWTDKENYKRIAYLCLCGKECVGYAPTITSQTEKIGRAHV